MKLEVNSLSKSYGNVKAVSDISFVAESGEMIGLLGRNGAGKSTMIKCIVGILSPDTGKVLFDGKDLNASGVKIGYLPEERGLYLNATVMDQLLYFASLNGVEKSEARKAAMKWLSAFEITQYANRKIKSLSKGNKQKVQLISAILHEPDLVILDEPFSGLDPINSEIFKKNLSVLKQGCKTVLLSSHRMEDIEELCTRVVMIKNGRLIHNSGIGELLSEYSSQNTIYLKSTPSDIDSLLREEGFKFSRDGSMMYTIVYQDDNTLYRLEEVLFRNNILITEIRHYQANLQDVFLKELSENEKK